jgi:transcriptional regulator with XRE-family HTH domain
MTLQRDVGAEEGGLMEDLDSGWTRKGATLSDKSARQEYGLTQDEICRAIRMGKLQYREHSIYGNPWLRLLRREVEALVKGKRGGNYLKERQAKTELARISRELKRLKTQIAELEERKSKLIAELGR